jgi:hypothetical protein
MASGEPTAVGIDPHSQQAAEYMTRPTVSFWDIVNMGFVFTVHAVMAALGWFIMSSSLQESALNISVQGLGIIMGFWLGMWVSPSTQRQRSDLISFGKAATAFISGYVFSKLDPLISKSLGGGSIDPITMFRVLAFLSSGAAQALLVALMSWYDVRPMSDRPVKLPTLGVKAEPNRAVRNS